MTSYSASGQANLVPASTARDLSDFVKQVAGGLCAQAGPKLIRCKGRVRFVELSGARIVGNGVRIEFTDPRPGKGGIVFVRAQHVSVSDFEVGWRGEGIRGNPSAEQRFLYSVGRVLPCAGNTNGGVLRLERLITGHHPVEAVSTWSDIYGWPWFAAAAGAREVNFRPNASLDFSDGTSQCVPELVSMIGQRVLARHYVHANQAVTCNDCVNMSVENVRITSAPGMGFVFNGGRNLTLMNNVIAPKCAPKCSRMEPSVASDGAHFTSVEKNILIQGNDFGWQGDDSVNVTGLLVSGHSELNSGNWVRLDERWKRRFAMLKDGVQVKVFDLGLNPLLEAEVVEVGRGDLKVRLSRVPKIPTELVLTRVDGMPRDIMVRKNHFHDHRARGILVNGSNAVIEDNIIERISMGAVLLATDTVNWFEGPGARHVIIRRNKISDVNRQASNPDYPSAISAGFRAAAGFHGKKGSPIEDLLVEDNEFSNIHSFPEQPVHFGVGVSRGRYVPETSLSRRP